VYQSKDAPLKPEQIEKASKRRMDCVDCHNRPTHIYVPPDRSVDESLLARRIDASLPFIKTQAVSALTGTYNSTPEALQGIATEMQKFYQEKYPQIAASKQHEIKQAIGEVQAIFQRTIFPEMKVDWKTHPSNIGHFLSAGCFRCHDGNHVSAEGKVVSKDCNACHTVLSEAESGVPIMGSATGIQFKHPVDLGDMTQVNCADCHTGGPM